MRSDGDDKSKIVVTSPEAMVEFFSGRILKPQCTLVKNPFNIGQGIFSLDVNRILGLKVTLDPLSRM